MTGSRHLLTRFWRTTRLALAFWRRSIQARVVVLTVLMSIVVVTCVGWILMGQTRQGLLDHRVDVVLDEVDAETADARARLAAASGTEVNSASQQSDLVEPIIERGQSRGFGVVLAGPEGEDPPLAQGGGEYTSGLDLSSVPITLEAHFDGANRSAAWTWTEVTRTLDDGSTVSTPGIAVGSQVVLPADGKTYTLYFLVPLTEEQETLGLVTRAVVTAASLLILLVAGLVWLVTRQVVTPIRMTRQVAERLAAGRLTERLRVSGEDDIARLALSFNSMASALQHQIRQLEELSWVQRRFVSDVSHELRTPLTTVRMASEVLHDARADFDPTTARAAELLQAELDRFEALLVDLLEISRFDAGAALLETEPVDLTEVVRRVLAGAESIASRRGVRVVVEAPSEPVRAEVDARRVARILRNLVSNAIDHAMADDPTEVVVIRVAADARAAAISVRDHGVGLAAGEAAMVFNRFWRSDPARARTSGGTGLGLAIALEDARLHGGWLEAWGRPGQGALFRLTIPLAPGLELTGSPLPLVPDDAPSDAARLDPSPGGVS